MFDLTTYIWATKTAAVIAETAAGGKTVEIQSASGHLDEDALETLKESKASMVALNGKVYRLSRIEGNDYKYINSLTEGSSQVVEMSELNINIDTGDFTSKPLIIEGEGVEELKQRLNEHINDMVAHITAEERAKWNNKVSAEVEILENGYNLKLING